MRSRALTVIAIVDAPARPRAWSSAARRRRTTRGLVRAARAGGPRRRPGRGRRAAGRAGGARRPTGTPARRETSIAVFAAFAPAAGRGASSGAAAADRLLSASPSTRLAPPTRLLDRAAAAARPADRPARDQRARPPTSAARPGRAQHPRLRRRRRRPRSTASWPTPAGLGAAHVELPRRPLRDAAAAARGRRPADLRVLVPPAPGTPTRAAPSSPSRAAGPGSASG